MRAKILLVAAMSSLTVGIGAGFLNAAEDLEAMTAAAASKWKAQREGVVTGHFSVRLYRYTSLPYKQKIPAKVFRALIDGQDARGVEAAIDKLQGLRGEMSMKNFKPIWGVPIEITCEGIKWRNEWKGSPYSSCIFNGKERVEYEAGIKQATIMPGRSHLEAFTIENLCNNPKERLVKEILGSREKRLEGGKVVVEIPKRKIVFDPTTGFVDLYTVAGPKKRWTEIRQTNPLQLEGGFMFPKAKVLVEYEVDYVRRFDVIIIDDAELNGAVPPETFIVSTPEKTTILDTREKSKGRYPSRRVENPVPDVLSFADAGDVKRIPELELPSQRSHYRWLYALLTLPLAALLSPALTKTPLCCHRYARFLDEGV